MGGKVWRDRHFSCVSNFLLSISFKKHKSFQGKMFSWIRIISFNLQNETVNSERQTDILKVKYISKHIQAMQSSINPCVREMLTPNWDDQVNDNLIPRGFFCSFFPFSHIYGPGEVMTLTDHPKERYSVKGIKAFSFI